MCQTTAAANVATLNNDELIAFLFAGDAIFTLVNPATAVRYTYRVEQKAYTFVRNGRDVKGTCYWVNLLTGPQNLTDYTFLGSLKDETVRTFALNPKSRVKDEQLASVQAISWLLNRIAAFEAGQVGQVMKGLEFWHVGRCGRCKAALTVPTSIENGFGPECVKYQAAGKPKNLKVRQLR